MTETLEAGPETDKLVAIAAGLEWKSDPKMDGSVSGLCVRVPVGWHPFNPTRNLNDAFLAAEKVGLFDSEGCVLDKERGYDAWRVSKNVFPSFDSSMKQVGTTQETPALAICAAILKLNSKPDESVGTKR